MITKTILAIIILYLFFTLFKKRIEKIIRYRLCSLCASVLITWVSLLFLKFFKFNIDPTIIAILIGESIAGLMYSLSSQQPKPVKNPVLNLFIITSGTVASYFILTQKFEVASVLIIFIIFLILMMISLSKNSKSKFTNMLNKKLEDCCD